MELRVLGHAVDRSVKVQRVHCLETAILVPLVQGQLKGGLGDVCILGGDEHLRKAAGGQGVGGGGGEGQGQGHGKQDRGGQAASEAKSSHEYAPLKWEWAGLCGPPQAFYYSGGGNKMQEIRLETREWEIFVN